MQRQAGGEKVLRACVVQGGKVIEEQRLQRRLPVSIGTGPKNTFVIADPSLPNTHRLFELHGGSYELVITDGMRGKVSCDGEANPVDLAALKAQGRLKKRGDGYALPLTDAHRGKVVIGGITIIFQFVVPPPRSEVAVFPKSARATLWQRVDKPMAALLLAFLAIEGPTIVSFYYTPMPAKVSIDTIDNRWAQLIVPDRKPKEHKPAPEPTKSKDGTRKELAKKAPPKHESHNEAERAKAKAARSAEIRKNIAGKGILAVLGTVGDGGASGAVADVFGGGITTDLDAAFEGISGVEVATAGGQRSTRGDGTGKAASIGGLATAGGGAVGLGAKKEARVGAVKTEAPEVDGTLDSDAIARVVRARIRMVQDCYERELKRNPQLSGKIEIEFTIGENGTVEDARVSNNRMGSDGVGACIVGRIRRWRFPRPKGGSVTVNYPFIFTPAA